MPIERFTVFGQRCSGTNALIKLVQTNLPSLAFCEETGFKHWLVPGDRRLPEDLLVIVIAREVQSWLRSLHRNPWHVVPEMRGLSFAQFIRAEWRTVWDIDFWGIDRSHPLFGKRIEGEVCPATAKPFANAVSMRATKLRNWLGLQERSAAFLQLAMHDLATDPASVVQRISAVSGHDALPEFHPVSSYKGEGNRPFVREVEQPLSFSDRAHVEEYWDRDIEQTFGFAHLAAIEG